MKKSKTLLKKHSLLPYGDSVSAPAIQLPDTQLFRNERSVSASNYFQEKIEAMNREYQELLSLANETELVYNSRYNFVPKVGHIYHLYWTGEEHVLSMIENWDRFDLIGSFRFTADSIWERVDYE